MSAPADVVLAVRGLTLPDASIRDLNLEVRAGESVALLGVEQEALTQVIRVIGGLERADVGQIEVLGVDVKSATRTELQRLRRRVGYVTVAGGLLSNMTLRANVELALRYHDRGDETWVRRRAEELLDEVGLLGSADVPASVAAAERQKCAAYIRALACDPQVLLVEDPAAFLHPEGRAAIERVHARLQRDGTTVLLADDDVALARRLAQRAVWCQDGTITFDGPIASLAEPGPPPSVTEIP